MESRRIPGEGLEHEQNYIEERLIDASNMDELAAQSEQLKAELSDLRSQSSQDSTQETSDRALEATANIPTEQSDVGSQARTVAAVGPVDPEAMPPISSARSTVVNDTGGGNLGS